MPDTDDPPELSRLEEGDDVRVYYASKRSGNEVDRRGEVAHTTQPDDETLYWVHTEEHHALKHQYVVLVDAETEAGAECVAAYSATVSAELPTDDPPEAGEKFTITFGVDRTSFLGIVDRVMRDGWNINVVQDGGALVAGGSDA